MGSGQRVAVVTGAASGIGKAVALAMAGAGTDLVLCDRDPAALAQLRSRVEAGGTGRAPLVLRADVSSSAAMDNLAARAFDRAGHVDAVVHCAGIGGAHVQVTEMTDDQWRLALDVNLTGSFNVGRAFGRRLATQRHGAMVFLASDRGLYGGRQVADYAASKGGVIALVKSLALELGPSGVTVNAINPGTTDTPLVRASMSDVEWARREQADPLGKLSRPEDIATMAFFLAFDAPFITGQVMTTRMRTG